MIIISFNKFKNLFKGISNAVEATSKEEQIHAMFGIELINIIKEERPDWFDDQFKNSVLQVCKEDFHSEKTIVDWIFEKGELDFLTKDLVVEFIKKRFNDSLESINFEKIFDVNNELVKETEWFYDEIITTKHTDFFNKRSINYSKKIKSITSEDLF